MYKIYILVVLFGTTCCRFPVNLDVEYEDLELESETTDSFNISTTNPTISDITMGQTNSNLTMQTSTEDNVLAMESHIKELSAIMKDTIHRIRQQFKKIDIVFLIDSSSSVGKSNFISELRFVVKFLSDFNVSFNYTRVGIVTFSSDDQIMRNIDHISEPDADNDKCKLLNFQMPSIEFHGGGTHTAGALLQAKSILTKARRHSKKIICLITDGFSNGHDPLPIANKLKEDNVTIITFGIQTGNFAELHKLSSEPNKKHSFLMNSFAQFESLARKALHTDYRIGNAVRIKNSTSCDTLCDKTQLNETLSCCDSNAECTCSTISGHYSCMCKPGYYGSGSLNDCELCPNGTFWHSRNLCKPCPDVNHVTSHYPALNSSSCVCKSGFKSDERNRCEILKCPELQPPANGYFVKHSLACDRVLNTACGARCKSGFQLVGSSIRLCLENGTWSGVEAKCVLKTCPKLSIPYYGMATCKNSDLNLFYDYTSRNESFMKYYDDEQLRTTELMPIDTDCKFKCGPGFYMIGSAMRNCLPLSKWDGLQTTCKQIFCSGLPEVTFGQYDPTDCTNQKVVHGSNCTIVCDRGFEVRGPAIKTCGGKKTGIWSNRNKLPKCVDVTPPEMSCPDGFSVPMLDDENYAIVKIFPAPNVTDNSDDNITYWLKPSVKDDGVKLTLGSHEFTYIAVDAFRNKAKCSFNITVLDITPPFIDNCIDPPEIFTPQHSNDNRTFVDWDHPIIYDNSGTDVNVTRSIEPGHLNVGLHMVTYIASDSADNQNTCTMNITVKALQCNTLSSPANGQSLCAKNQTHTWCDVICDAGYTMYDSDESQHSDNIRLVCEDDQPQWKNEPLLDCTKIELPDSIEQVFSITLEDDINVCDNSSNKSELMIEGVLKKEIRQQLCQDSENCEVLSEMPDCDSISKSANASSNESNDRNYYRVVKRDVSGTQNKSTINMKIRVYVKISKSLGLWNQSLSRTANLDIVKNELKTYHTNERLRNQLDTLRINVKHLNLEENLLCRSGSVLKRSVCVQCPKGTFHNKALNSCQMCKIGYYNGYESQIECQKCPQYQSTRKYGAKSIEECIEQCPPGTTARLRMRASRKLQNSLMPFCRKCPPTQYQPKFDQTECLNCPSKMTSPRGSISIDNCIAQPQHICQMNVGICGPHGVCIPENQNLHLYSCLCEEGFTGAHCEKQINLCASVPCHNGGKCSQTNSTSYNCQCSDRFTGELCETEKKSCSSDYCHNGGTCIETDRKPVCECSQGFVGEFCEIHQNYCLNNPCESGECSNNNDGFECKCPPGVIGKRCHLRPCDYLPCHKNAHCVNLPVLGATRRSYRCVCPKGFKGDACTQIKSACESNPCKNNAQCTPIALRNGSALTMNMDLDADVYERYTCKCRPYFYGINCEIFVTPDYVLEFTKPGVHNYVKLNGPTENLNEISLCTWLQTNDSFNYGTIFSYATENIDNMFTLTDYNGIVLYVNGKNFITDITLNDGEWHFICVTWMSENGKFEIYIDGNLHDSGTNLSAGMSIEANGTIIVGQEQDSIGSSFSDSESFIGRIAYLDIWNRRVTSEEMFEYYTTCEPYQGNLFTWTDFRSQIYGAVKIVQSPFCKSCPQNLLLRNGFIRYLSNRAFHYCANGYQMQGSSIRNCLRTSKWSLPIPYCRSVQCGHLSSILNGQITIEKTSSGEVVSYSCNENYNLNGSSSRTCQANGTWSGLQPECISIIKCSRLEPPNNAKLIYANEHGRVKYEPTSYPMGTFVEVQCLDGFIIKGESFLSCSESGTWDLPIPECIKIQKATTTTTTKPTTMKSTTSTTTTARTTKVTNLFRSPVNTSTKGQPKIFYPKPTYESTKRTIAIKKNPNLARIVSTTTKIPTTTEHVQNDATTKMFKETTTERISPLNEHVPDKVFWSKLKRLYYNGCNNDDAKPDLCVQLKNPSYYTDLSLFELPETSEFKHMDRRLLSLVKQADDTLNTDSSITLNMENVFPFILYQKINVDDLNSRMSGTTENAFRFILGLYIDTILLDKHLNSTNLKDIPQNDDSNITQQLKFFIIRLASKINLDDASQKLPEAVKRLPDLANRNSRSALTPTTQASNTLSTVNIIPETIESPTTSSPKMTSEQSDESVSTKSSKSEQSFELSLEELSENALTASELRKDLIDKAKIPVQEVLENEPIEEMCRLETLPDWAPNSYITEIKIENETLFNKPDRLYLIGPVAIRTRAYIACKDGFKQTTTETIYFECSAKSIWLGKLIECEAVTCNKPAIPNELLLSSRLSRNNSTYTYTVGKKLLLKCNIGYELKGEPFIQCMATGKWSRSASDCSRISCQKPDLPSNVAIIGGRSYLYLEKLSIKCANNDSFEIQCNADGKWSKSPKDVC